MLAPRLERIRSPNARSGPGVRIAAHAASTSRCLASEEPRLEMPPCRAGADPRLADPGVEPEVGDEVPRRGEPSDVSDGSHHSCSGTGAHPRDGHDPADLRPAKNLLGDRPVHQAELTI